MLQEFGIFKTYHMIYILLLLFIDKILFILALPFIRIYFNRKEAKGIADTTTLPDNISRSKKFNSRVRNKD